MANKYYSLPVFNQQIGVNIRHNWGIARLFKWLKDKCPIHGDSLILAQILIVSKRFNRTFKQRSIMRVINNIFEEKVSSEVKRYLINLI